MAKVIICNKFWKSADKILLYIMQLEIGASVSELVIYLIYLQAAGEGGNLLRV